MKYFWLLSFIVLFNCNNASKHITLHDFIAEDSYMVIKASSPERLNSNLKNNAFLNSLSKTSSYKTLDKKLEPLAYLKTEQDIVLSFSKDASDSLHFTLSTKFGDSLFQFNDVKNLASETLTFNNRTLQKYTLNGQTLYTAVRDSILIASSSQTILDALLQKKIKADKTPHLIETSNTEASFSIALNHDAKWANSPMFLLDSVSMSQFSKQTLLDADVSQDQLFLNGITQASDSIQSLINVFKGTKPQENKLAQLTPANADGFMSITFGNFTNFQTNLDKFQKAKNLNLQVQDSTNMAESLFATCIELGVVYAGNNQAIVLNTLDNIATKDALSSYETIAETYRNVDVINFGNGSLFKNTLYPFVTQSGFNFYAELDSFFVFANSMEMLQNIIASYQNGTTYYDRSHYQSLSEQLSNASSLLMVFNEATLGKLTDTNNELDAYKSTAVQFIYDRDFAHVHMAVKKAKVKADSNTVSEVFNINLDAEILNAPQFVTNHTNKQKDIVVQDVSNNLYLISNKGEILWKKKLEGAVLGRVHQVDIFKNGRLQLAFATPNRLYVIDRNGKDVGAFPLKFGDAITQPLSVFDYDNKRDYRLVVTQGKNILMYNLEGKIVKGFDFDKTAGQIVTQPEHIRIGSKDYIVVKTKEKLYILDRRGGTRVSPKNSSTYSNEPVFLYNGNFATTTQSGILWTVDQKGNTASQNIGLNEQHHIDATSKTIAAMSDNKLRIKTHTVELDFGIYTAPKIFYVNDKIYISVTDLQTNKLYLFDSLGKPIANFPVYGSSKIDLDNIDGSRNVEIVTKSDNNGIIVYQIN